MPKWVLICVKCSAEFQQSQVSYDERDSYNVPLKPELPSNTCVCPNCGYSAPYQRTDWIYRASGYSMPCKSCGSVNRSILNGEIGIHFPGLKGIDKPVVWVFPKLVVCLECGTAEFVVPEAELRQLRKSDAAGAG